MIYLNKDHTALNAVIFDLGNVLLDYQPRRFMAENTGSSSVLIVISLS